MVNSLIKDAPTNTLAHTDTYTWRTCRSYTHTRSHIPSADTQTTAPEVPYLPLWSLRVCECVRAAYPPLRYITWNRPRDDQHTLAHTHTHAHTLQHLLHHCFTWPSVGRASSADRRWDVLVCRQMARRTPPHVHTDFKKVLYTMFELNANFWNGIFSQRYCRYI